ncbi:hypothetical protein [Streptosporangium sp. NPDC051022]|uniref:hypothetical protein n=1 Tax=Streptosporangium sp. NPDC051022 TaxID=3155752 RepID=UPI003446F6D6
MRTSLIARMPRPEYTLRPLAGADEDEELAEFIRQQRALRPFTGAMRTIELKSSFFVILDITGMRTDG